MIRWGKARAQNCSCRSLTDASRFLLADGTLASAKELLKAGHPTVVFVFDSFEQSARAQARAFGADDLPIYAYRQFEPGAAASAGPEEIKAVQAVHDFPALLLELISK